ncbi:restriction endonuclease subunit S [Amycolatopsis sp. QT-25]|uniref:restriction endonuclease subunit S n=1 Tax=Amycolatopsis sp. QT-25 TaxID=3034022 RepID=UPI0023EC7F98|nr:restriction endonuclease subunit S [Amycolatopsis sp. QT-25]WET78671.1 restriction endonuclease subunit S [Amycolatopsis sp. QT-25]
MTIAGNVHAPSLPWKHVLLDDVAARGSGHTPDKKRADYWNGGIPWVSLKDTFRLDRGPVLTTTETITRMGLANSSAVVHPMGSVVLLRDAGIGKSAVLGADMAVSQHFMAWNCGPRLDNWYLYYYLQYMKPEFERISNGSTIKTIGLDYFRQLEIPLPPIEEQRLIAQALRDVDDLIDMLERMLVKKQAIKQGMMQKLLTGRTRLAGFTKPWELKRLGDLLAYEQPGRYLVSTTEYGDVGTPVLTAGKTFVLGRTMETHGVYCAVPVIIFDDFTTASKLVTFPFKAKSSAMKILGARPGVNLRYAYERMQLIDYTVVDHKRRWIAEYSKIEIEVPENAEQCAIASVLDDVDAEVNALEARIAKTRAMKAGMMQELLTGSTRLPVVVAS